MASLLRRLCDDDEALPLDRLRNACLETGQSHGGRADGKARLLAGDTREDRGDKATIGLANLPHANPVDDWVCEEVEHRQEINNVELGTQDGLRNVVDVDMGRKEVEDHVGKPEDDESARQ